jgi:predicted nucleic acid-binding protein
MFKRQAVSVELARQALTVYREIPIQFIDVPLEKALELSHAQNIYAYDAYLLQCAQQTSTSLLTLDHRLKDAAENAGVHTLEVGP